MPGAAGLVLHLSFRNIELIRSVAKIIAMQLMAKSVMFQLTSMQSVLIAFLIDAAVDCPFFAMCSETSTTYINIVKSRETNEYCYTMHTAIMATARDMI